MKLVSVGERGNETPGVLAGPDEFVSLRELLSQREIEIADLASALPHIERVRDLIDRVSRPSRRLRRDERIGAPITSPANIFVVGANYSSHARVAEALDKRTALTRTVIFQKPLGAVAGPFDPIERPNGVKFLDYEAELALVIGKRTRDVHAEQAWEHIAGFMNANDVSSRERFMVALAEGRAPDPMEDLLGAKGRDGFLPTGPWLTTSDEASFDALCVECWVNGELRQSAPANSMIVNPAELVARISAAATLLPGDIIVTGSPDGVGGGMKPPKWLEDGDVIEIEITGLGRMRTVICGAHGRTSA